jgi:magnesium chelatase family protein
MFIKINSCTVFGLEPHLIEIELDSAGGLPSYIMVGLPDTAVKESKERIYSAIRNSGYQNPVKKLTINLAPADIAKKGTLFDLPIAIGILAGSGQVKINDLAHTAFVGELALDGALRKVNGILPMCLKLQRAGIKRVLLPADNAPEGALVEELEIIPLDSLQQAVEYLNKDLPIAPYALDISAIFADQYNCENDFRDIKGNAQAKRCLEICAAGGHNLLMVGSPGAGKTLLARSLPSILPPLELSEALEITKLYSINGLLSPRQSLITRRVFRSPHHTISHIGLIGGGTMPKPGEVSLANLGILFLDEIPEFNRSALEVLRQPLEDGEVTISRALSSITFPARFTLVAAMNPCPCGNHLDPARECSCTPYQVQNYWAKLSGPLLDRIDLHIEVPRLKEEELLQLSPGESSKQIRQRVISARETQKERFTGLNIFTNSQLTPKYLKEFCRPGEQAMALLRQANSRFHFSARAYDRLLKVSRTIADLDNSPEIETVHIAESLQYRTLDKNSLKG